jgi:hypothetical protein
VRAKDRPADEGDDEEEFVRDHQPAVFAQPDLQRHFFAAIYPSAEDDIENNEDGDDGIGQR